MEAPSQVLRWGFLFRCAVLSVSAERASEIAFLFME